MIDGTYLRGRLARRQQGCQSGPHCVVCRHEPAKQCQHAHILELVAASPYLELATRSTVDIELVQLSLHNGQMESLSEFS